MSKTQTSNLKTQININNKYIKYQYSINISVLIYEYFTTHIGDGRESRFERKYGEANIALANVKYGN